MMLDFEVVDVGAVTDDAATYRAILRSHFDQQVVVLEYRYGVWCTQPDDRGAYQHALPEVAAVLQREVKDLLAGKSDVHGALVSNPFLVRS